MKMWHKIGTTMVCVDESTGKVTAAKIVDGYGNLVPAVPCKWSRWRKAYEPAHGVKLSTLKSGISRGTYTFMQL